MNDPLPLRSLQQWMLDSIAHRGAGSDRLDELILPSCQQSAAERLAVYSNAYFARLIEVLRDLFPCLRFAVGDELFDQFALGYLQAHPPTSYTLHRLADQFAEFLEATRPHDDDSTAFVVDLACLEHAIDQVFDGPGPEPGSGVFRGEKLNSSSQPNSAKDSRPLLAGDSRLDLIPGFRLLAFRFPASSYFTAWKAGERPAWPEPGAQWIALLRRDYIVRRLELTAGQFDLLTHLAAGQTLDDSLAAVASSAIISSAASIDELADDVRRWFTRWAAEGFFAELPAAT